MKKFLIFSTVCLFAVFATAVIVLSYLAFQQVSGDYVRFAELIANFFQTFAVLCILAALVLQYIQTKTAKEHKFVEAFFQLLQKHQEYIEYLNRDTDTPFFDKVYADLKKEIEKDNNIASDSDIGTQYEEMIGKKYEEMIGKNDDLKNYYRSLSHLLKLIIHSGLQDEDKSYYKHQIRMKQSQKERDLMYYDRFCPNEGERFEKKLKELKFSLAEPANPLRKENTA